MRLFALVFCSSPYAFTTVALLFAVGCSEYSGPSEYERQKAAKQFFLDEVAAQGGTAEEKQYEMYGKSGQAWAIDLSGAQISDELIDSMGTLDYIAELDLSNSSITDAQLLKFDDMKLGRVLLDLDLTGTQISDAALDGLTSFFCLREMKLKGTKVTPAGVERFKKSQQSNPDVQLPFRNPKVEL